MQFEAVLASAESKGDAPSRFELRSNPATDEVVFYVSPDPALPQKPRDYSHATRAVSYTHLTLPTIPLV